MKLYVDQLAPNARRVLMCLAERGIDLEIEKVSVAKGAHRTEAFLAKNPLGQVPLLELPDGVCIAESMAICRYLDETSPGPSLFGVDPIDRARIHMWTRRVESGIFVAAVELGHHGHPLLRDRFQQIPAFADLCRDTLAKTYDLLNGHLRDTSYVGGAAFSVADVVAFCGIELAKAWEAPPHASLASLARWHEMIAARPSASIARYV
jgi:glutathione S-transferase